MFVKVSLAIVCLIILLVIAGWGSLVMWEWYLGERRRQRRLLDEAADEYRSQKRKSRKS